MAVANLDIDDDFSEMCVGSLMAKCIRKLFQREVLIEHRPIFRDFDGADQVVLMWTATDRKPDDSQLLRHHQNSGDRPGKPRENADESDVTAVTRCGYGLR